MAVRPGAAVTLTYEQAVALYRQGLDPTVAMLLALDQENTRLRADNEELQGAINAARAGPPSAPSGSIPPYAKPNTARGRRRRRPGRKQGHPGVTRARPARIDEVHSHPPLANCPRCHTPLPQRPSELRERIIEGLVAHKSHATLHQIPRQYCCRCEKLVEPTVTDAMAHDRISRYTYVLTAWLHYRCGLSTANLVALLAHSGLELSPGALTQGWQRLGTLLSPAYDQILARVKRSLVLMADETGWRIHGVTHWLWYFGCTYWSYYLLDRHRGTAVVHTVIGTVFDGVLLVDFWGAYNAIETWAKQRCLFASFTSSPPSKRSICNDRTMRSGGTSASGSRACSKMPSVCSTTPRGSTSPRSIGAASSWPIASRRWRPSRASTKRCAASRNGCAAIATNCSPSWTTRRWSARTTTTPSNRCAGPSSVAASRRATAPWPAPPRKRSS